jgi:glutathione transport system permease protein
MLGILITLVLVSVVVFMLIHMIPGDPARLMAPENASYETILAVQAKYGLDRPLPEQYIRWTLRAMRGDFGESMRSKQPVLREISIRYLKTIRLAVFAILWATAAGILVGIWTAVHLHRWQDYIGVTVAVVGQAVPNFWIGMMLILLLGVKFKLLPIVGSTDWKSMIMPVITLGSSVFAVVTRYTRSAVIETLKEDYTRTARAKGLPERIVIRDHVFRNSMIPVVTIVGLQFGYMLGGSVLVEAVFGYNGIGALLVSSIKYRDYPVVQALVLIFSLHFVFINLFMDMLYVVLNPEIRLK